MGEIRVPSKITRLGHTTRLKKYFERFCLGAIECVAVDFASFAPPQFKPGLADVEIDEIYP